MRAVLLLPLLHAANSWKPDKQPDNEACASWCVFDNGEKGHVDACTDTFKRHQCQGCERCKVLHEAEAKASTAQLCEACRANCCGDTPSAYLAELDKLRSERDAFRAELATLRTQLEHTQLERTQLERTQLERTEVTAVASTSCADGKDSERKKATPTAATTARCADVLLSLRSQQPESYMTLMLNTATNASLRTVAGGFIGQLVARRPWHRMGDILGDKGGVHGIGSERLKTIETWALNYRF